MLGGRWSVVEVVLGLIDFSIFATYFPTSPNTVFSTVTSSTRSSSTASPELCFRVLWVHCDLPCAHLLPWATSCSPKTAGYQPYQLEAGAGDPVAGRDPLPAPIAYLNEQWRPPELLIVGRASWTTRPTPFAATPRLLPPA